MATGLPVIDFHLVGERLEGRPLPAKVVGRVDDRLVLDAGNASERVLDLPGRHSEEDGIRGDDVPALAPDLNDLVTRPAPALTEATADVAASDDRDLHPTAT